MASRQVGTTLVAVGVALLLSTVVVSAVTAPPAETDRAGEQSTLVGSQGGGLYWHSYGSVYRVDETDTTWRMKRAGSYFDVTRLDNGTVLAGFVDTGYDSCGPYSAPCAKTGFRIVDPEPTPHVVSEYAFPVRSVTNSEVHDVERLPSGEFLLADMEHERLVAVAGGSVTWQWNASSVYDAPEDPTRRDWLHINDVDAIGDDRYLVSVRNANQLLVVARGDGVVEVINRDASATDDGVCAGDGQLVNDSDGARCGDPTVLDHQHNPQWLGNGTVLVADSENDRLVELSRTADGDWEPVWTLERAGGYAFEWPRDADRLPNGNTLITDSANRRVLEVNESGGVVWRVHTRRIPYEADRISSGERAGSPPHAPVDGANVSAPVSDDVPVLTAAVVELRAVAPSLPHWYHEPQLGLTLLSVGLVGVGVLFRR